MNPAEIIFDSIMGASGYSPELVGLVGLTILVLFLTTTTGSKGLLLISLLAFLTLFAVVVPAFGWIMWLLILVSIGLIVIGLRIWFSKIF